MDTQIPTDKIVDFIEDGFEKAMPTLIKFLEIPSQSRSFDSEYLTNGLLLQTADLLKDWILAQDVKGLKLELHNDEGLSPFLFGQVEGSTPDCQTILFYGHMDKQPPMEPWFEGLHPHKPVLRDGKLYGRGGADDGYSIFASVLAVKACQTFGLKHPRIVMLFEADEESGSLHIHHYLKKLESQIGKVALVICLDSGCGNYEQLWTTTTLRGYCMTQFTVTVLTEGVHSGDASGVVPSSFRIARTLLERIENSTTGEVNPAFQVNIPGERYQQAEQAALVLGQITIDKFPYASKDMKPVTSDPFQAYLNRVWRAQLSVTGCDGIPACKNGGNVLRTHTTLKLSLRLPPTADGKKAEQTMIELLTKDVPYGATVTIDAIMVGEGWNCPPNQPYIHELLTQASEIYFKKPALSLGEGGSIPLMGVLQGLYPHSQFIVTGVLGPHSNAHGPNEFLHVPFTKKLICSLAHFVATSYTHFSKAAN